MCNFDKKLIARMDAELPEGESADMEQHLSACDDCRNGLATYERASRAFDSYCEASFIAASQYKSPHRAPQPGIVN